MLVAVAISIRLGNNGLFNTAKIAGESYKISQTKEIVEVEILTIDIEKVSKWESLIIEQILIEINKKGTFEEINLDKI